jgi:hypothetical protein
MSSSYVQKLSPAKGSIFTRWWFLIIVSVGIAVMLGLLARFGTINLSGLFSGQVAVIMLVIVLIFIFAKVIYDSHFVDYYLESAYNHEVYMGKKRGEFTFTLEGRTFHVVDCGKIKLVLLQGTVGNHEKKVVTPSISRAGKIFTIQSLRGQRLKKLVLRGVPITDVAKIRRLGWIGNTAISEGKDATTSKNIESMIKSPDWTGVIWIAPSVPDEVYKQFLFNETTLAEIETTYQANQDLMLHEFNERVDQLKTHFTEVSSELLHETMEVMRVSASSFEDAGVMVAFMLGKHPSEIQDAMSALNLEANIGTLPSVLEKKAQEIERVTEALRRMGRAIGMAPSELEEQIEKMTEAFKRSKKKEKQLTPPQQRAVAALASEEKTESPA